MEGKRFAVGLFAGLLLGVAIITASGGLVTLSSGAAPASKNAQGSSALTTTTLVTETATVAQTVSTSSVPAYFNLGNKSLSSTTTTPATPGSASLNSSLSNLNGVSTSSTPAYSSRVQSIPHQPLLTDTVVFVPVFVAFLLGALLYRASRGKEQPSEG
jgi:hypothetical protein